GLLRPWAFPHASVGRALLRRVISFSNPFRCDKRRANASHAGPRADAAVGSCKVARSTTDIPHPPSILHDLRTRKPSMSSDSPSQVAGGDAAVAVDAIARTARKVRT